MKNLVYYCLNGTYNDLLDLSLTSLRMFYSGDVLIITDEKNLETLKNKNYKNVDFMVVEINNMFYASANKIKIFDYEKFLEYDTCLFLDCDTLVIDDIDIIFKECKSYDKVLVVEEESWYGFVQMYGPWYGGDLFTKEENDYIKETNVNGINGGVFCLPATEKSKNIFKNIYLQLSDDFIEKKTNCCLEQPYLNYHLYKNDYYFPMTEKIKTHPLDINLSECENKLIIHFFGGVGNFYNKYKKMQNTFKQLKNKKNMIKLKTRIDFFLDKKDLIIAELGVFTGDFSKELLTTNPKILYLVDIWNGQMTSGNKDGNNIIMINNMEKIYEKLLIDFNNENVKIIKSKSVDFLTSLENDTLDIVYIDSVHDYETTMIELILSVDKVKKDGYICGHDYTQMFPLVVKAVDEFCKNYNYNIEFITMDGCPSFFIKNDKL
jgi:hypothetical protein